jgi:molybdate transport system substrate-binding protein
MRKFRFLLLCWIGWNLGAAHAELVVAVASNFAQVAQKLSHSFQQQTGHSVKLVFGSTGGLYAQIKQGAPYQVMMSADDQTPARLVAEGRAIAGTQMTYALGRLALWSRQPGVVDDRGQALKSEGLARLAVANPELAPYVAASVQVLQRMGLWPALQRRMVQGENIGQVFQFVQSGNVPMGFVAWSQISLDGKLLQGSAWLVPADWHQPIRQDAVLLKAGQGQTAALAWLSFLSQESTRTLIRSHGYSLQS